jgi:hypothetical protein
MIGSAVPNGDEAGADGGLALRAAIGTLVV